MRSPLTFLSYTFAAACCAPFVPAQVTSPFGYDSTEGASSHGYILGNRVGLTWQQIDATLRNKLFTAKSIAWRRDGNTATNPDFVARTMEMEIYLGESDLTQISTNHPANYTNVPTNVVKVKTVNAPDWTAMPPSAPAKFDFAVPFDTSYLHLGKADFLWEVRVTKNSYSGSAFTNYPYDFQYVVSGGSFSAPPTQSSNTKLGTGCAVQAGTNFTLDTSLYNHGIKFRFTQAVTNGPANTAVTSFIGLQDLNAAVPGWCERVRTDVLFGVPIGVSDAFGAAKMEIDNIVYDSTLIGLPLYSQAVADNSGAIALSNGVRFVAGSDPKYPKVGRVYTYNVGTGQTKSGPWTGGIIALFQ